MVKNAFENAHVHYLGHLVSGTSILPLTGKIEALMLPDDLFA